MVTDLWMQAGNYGELRCYSPSMLRTASRSASAWLKSIDAVLVPCAAAAVAVASFTPGFDYAAAVLKTQEESCLDLPSRPVNANIQVYGKISARNM
jgi:hypothetical protein